jgi:serine/threonine protein kinase
MFLSNLLHKAILTQFLLCAVSDKKARQHLNDIHGCFFLHPTSGAWMFKNLSREHRVTYIGGNGSCDDVLGYNRTAVLWQLQNRLHVGPYHYQFQFMATTDYRDQAPPGTSPLVAHEGRYRAVRDAFIAKNPNAVAISQYLNPLPRSTNQRFRDYVLHDNIAVSSRLSTRVQAGVDVYTGEPVALKFLAYSDAMPSDVVSQLRHHIMTMFHFNDQPIGILPLVKFKIDHTHQQSRVMSTHIAMPLALDDFGSFDFTTILHTTHLRLFHHTLQGLAIIHERGFIHGGIKPGHLLICSINPSSPSAAICDFGNSIRDSSSANRDTIRPAHAVAPEVWTATDEKPYTNLSDVWSLAYSWLWTLIPPGASVPGFEDEPPHPDYFYGVWKADVRGLVTVKRHAAIMAFIDEAVNLAFSTHDADGVRNEFKILLKQMLAWDPDARVSAASALESPIWAHAEAGNAAEMASSSRSAAGMASSSRPVSGAARTRKPPRQAAKAKRRARPARGGGGPSLLGR